MASERVGLVIGADASEFKREMQGAGKEVEKLDRVLNRGSRDGVFSQSTAKKYDEQLGKVRMSMGRLVREYQLATTEIRKMEAAHQKIIASGQKVAATEKQRLVDMRAAARSQQYAITTMSGRLQGIEDRRAGLKTPGMLQQVVGLMARRFTPLAIAYGAYRAGSWIKGQADEGYATALQNEMARMTVGRLEGRDPRSLMYRRSRRGIERYGRSLAYKTAETLQMHQAGLQASGRLPWGLAKQNLAMIRGYSLDPGALYGYQAATRHAGGGVALRGANMNLSLLRGRAMGGFSTALTSEFAQSVTGLLSSTLGSRARYGPHLMPGLMGIMSRRLGGVFQQSPMATARILGGLHSTITAPGGGEAGQAFMFRALGFGKGKSYAQVMRQMEKGITDPSNISALLGQVKREYKTDDEREIALTRISGGQIKMWQARRLLDMQGPIDNRSVAAAMKKQKVTSPEEEAAKSRVHTGFARREIAMAEQRAALRVQLDPAYRAIFNIQIALLKKIADGVNAGKNIDISERIKGALTGKLNLGQILGIYPIDKATPTAAKGKPPGR